jgi:hypothetical protein
MRRCSLSILLLVLAVSARAQSNGILLGPTTAYWEGSIWYIAGTATNTTNHVFDSVTIEINLFDDLDGRGAVVGSTLAMVANLAPQQTWKWKAPVYEETAKSYRIVRVIPDLPQ